MRLVVGEVWAAKCEGVGYGRKDNMTRTLLLRLTSQPPTHSRLLLAQVIGPKNLQALWQVGTLAGWDAGMRAPRNSGPQALRHSGSNKPPSHKATQPQFQPPAPRFRPPRPSSFLLRKHNINDNGPATPAPCLQTRWLFSSFPILLPHMKEGSKGHATPTWPPIPATRYSSWRTHHSWGDLTLAVPLWGAFPCTRAIGAVKGAQRSAQG
jgi:hypothetical protein